MTETTETAIPHDFLGINPTDINKKLVSWGISLDEVVQKLASLGLPGIIFIIAAGYLSRFYDAQLLNAVLHLFGRCLSFFRVGF